MSWLIYKGKVIGTYTFIRTKSMGSITILNNTKYERKHEKKYISKTT